MLNYNVTVHIKKKILILFICFQGLGLKVPVPKLKADSIISVQFSEYLFFPSAILIQLSSILSKCAPQCLLYLKLKPLGIQTGSYSWQLAVGQSASYIAIPTHFQTCQPASEKFQWGKIQWNW